MTNAERIISEILELSEVKKKRSRLPAEIEVGTRFGHLVTTSKTELKMAGNSRMISRVEVTCDCGKSKTMDCYTLRANRAVSCGGCEFRPKTTGRIRTKKGEGGMKSHLSGLRRNAANRKIGWDLSDEQFFNLVVKNCHYCGSPPSSVRFGRRGTEASHEWSRFVANGIDRIDSKKPYSSDNCVPSCPTCNHAKWSKTQEEHEKWMLQALKHNWPKFKHALIGIESIFGDENEIGKGET